jgi:hypothetical protein
MSHKQWLAVGALASFSFAVTAQQVPDRPNPLDANATVPAPSYKSAFENFQKLPKDEQPSADKVWRTANDEVAKSDADSGQATADAPAPPAPAKTPPMDHSKHH